MNLKNLTYKQKYQLVLAGCVLVFILVYELSIQKTIYYYQLSKEQDALSAGPRVSEFDLDVVRQKEKMLNKVLGHFAGVNENSDKILLNAISGYCLENQVLLREFGAAVESKDSVFSTYTNKITLEGSFTRVLNMVDALEKNKNLGKISSVSFKSYMDYKSGNLKLLCIIYLRNLKTLNESA